MKNVLLVIKKNYLFIVILFIVGCSNDSNLILVNNDEDNIIDYPKEVNVNYRGYKIALGVLINEKGNYKLIDMNEELTLFDGVGLTLSSTDMFGLEYEIKVDSVLSKSDYINKKDTFYYVVDNEYLGNQKVEEVVETFKGLVDTLIKKHSIDSVDVDSIPW